MKKVEVKNFLKRNRNFLYLWTSQSLSMVTTNMLNFVMAIRIYEKTGSTLAVSFLWIFYYIPSIIFGPFMGYFVDRVKLRKMLTYVNTIQGVVILLFLFTGPKVYLIYPIVFLYSFTNLLYFPAEAASLVWLVKKEDLSLANSLFLLTSQSALVAGLGLSGLVMRLFGKNVPIYIASLGSFVAAAATYLLPRIEPSRVKKKLDDFSKFISEIKLGFFFIFSHRRVLFPILLLTFFQVFMMTMAILLPSFAANVLNIDVQDAGPSLILPLGLGALFATYVITRHLSTSRKKNLMKKGFLLAFLVFFLFSLILPFLGAYRVVIAGLLMFVLGIAGLFIFIPSQTMLQENTPSLLRGRVFGTWGFMANIVTLPFLLFSASIIDALGVRLFLFIAATVMFLSLIFLDKARLLVAQEENGTH